jgi:hypothetical protein
MATSMTLKQEIGRGVIRLNAVEPEIKRTFSAEADRACQQMIKEAEKNRAEVRDKAHGTRQHGTRQNVSREASTNCQALAKEFQSTQKSATKHIHRHISGTHAQTRSHIGGQFSESQKQAAEQQQRSRFINSFRFPEMNE